MACTGCFDNCAGRITPDTCVKYTGPSDTLLDITQGDSLYMVLQALIEAFNDTTDASKINLDSIGDGCTFFTNELAGKSLTVENVITALVDSVCCLKDSVTTLQGEVEPSLSFDTSCFDVAEDATIGEILQAAFIKICSINTTVNTISGDYVKASELCTLVTQCVANTASTQEYTKMPKYVALPYHGPTSVFDANGKGLAASGYDKVYMCLGQTVNGFVLPDYRGRSPIGANTGVPIGGMDSVVNPALTANAGYAIGNKTKTGQFTHVLGTLEQAAHTHIINDPTHFHYAISSGAENGLNVTSTTFLARSSSQGNNESYSLHGTGISAGIGKTSSQATGVTMQSSGGNQAHNTTHPVIGAVMVMYVP